VTVEPVELFPGAWHLAGYLSGPEQARLAARCRELGAAPAGFYVPTVRGGARMSIQMCCLGRHWNARTYRYEDRRSDHDGLPVQALPADLSTLARAIAHETGMAIEPDICILNYYSADAKLGLHQDRDERPETIAAGVPIVSVSLGDTGVFKVGGMSRADHLRTILLASGDAFVMGGPSRLRYHGVSRIQPGTGPAALGVDGRFNLTFRQY
jgi:alkylated DNA repair protein (DNA oxidative demethylase)